MNGKKKLSVLNVIVGGYGKTVSDIPNSEKCRRDTITLSAIMTDGIRRGMIII